MPPAKSSPYHSIHLGKLISKKSFLSSALLRPAVRWSCIGAVALYGLATGNAAEPSPGADNGVAVQPDPVTLPFHRQAVRRFIFSNNIPLSELVPSEIVAQASMHPAFASGAAATPDKTAKVVMANGTLVMGEGDTSLYVGGVNPYATYEVDVRSIQGEAEVSIDLATLGLGKRVQVVSGTKGVLLRLSKDGKTEREQVFSAKPIEPPYLLRAQLSGIYAAVFVTKDGATKYIGHTGSKEDFRGFADFRDRKFASGCTFNVGSQVAPGGNVTLGGARSYLSAGVGQADIRMITHKDGAPYWDNNRLWFTFSARGLGIDQSAQGVMSLDPSVFDIKFEGVIVYDHGDGLLRNDYSSHITYDDDAKEWQAIACDFGGVAGHEGRSKSGLVVARSAHDPRRGFSVMGNARQLADIDGMHEDPCLIFDAEARKWRLVACGFANKGIRTEVFEADKWDGPFTRIAGPTIEDSTGVLIQKMGDKRYVFSGNSAGPMLIYSYPDLKPLGEMKIDLPAHWPNGPGRGWPNVFPLPPGFPFRYMALMMDRPNFPDVKGANWSYGALHLFGAYTDDISNAPYEYPAYLSTSK